MAETKEEFYKRLSLIPLEELEQDRIDAIEGIRDCNLSISIGVVTYISPLTFERVSITDRLKREKQHLEVINAELERRETK